MIALSSALLLIASPIAEPGVTSCRPQASPSTDPVPAPMAGNDVVLRARVYTMTNPVMGRRTVLVPVTVYKGPTRVRYLLSPAPTVGAPAVATLIDRPDEAEVIVGLRDSDGSFSIANCAAVHDPQPQQARP